MMQSFGKGGGSYSSQSWSFSSSIGSDGRWHTEQHTSSAFADSERNFRQRKQTYSNSSSGVDKISLERQMGERGKKVVRERNRHTQE